jgi:hypothetical protein
MASTYVNDLRLNEMATGDASGSWGTVTNTNLELIGEAFSYGTETIGDADSTLTIADGAADAARSFYLKITSSVDLTTTRIVTLGPNTVSKVWMIENATTGSQVITIKQGSGATINVPNGQVKMISTDGAGSGGAVLDLLVDVDLTGTTTLVNLNVSGAVDIAGDLTLSAGGDGALRFTAASSVKVLDNNAAALVFEEADNAYMTFVTTDGSEAVKFDKALDINAATQIDATVTVGVDDTGYDVKFFGATAGAYMLWDESADDLILGGAAGLSVNSTALVTGVLTTTAATVSNGGGQFNGAINVGVDDTGYDVKFFGATAGAYMLWDESADDLILGGAAGLSVNSAALVTGVLTANGGAVFNESGADVDFRVESDTDANALFVQGSDGFVGIGTSSPTHKLTVGGYSNVNAANKLAIGDNADYQALIYMESANETLTIENTSDYAGRATIFKDNGSERCRIDSSGNVLVGKSATAFGTAGIEARAGGTLWATASETNAASFNRLSTDGAIAYFSKDGTTVGSIGVFSGNNLYIGGSVSGHAGLQFGSSQINPMQPAGTASDNAVDLGASTERFKDLYLSGGVYLGGSVAANKLDDYEEGAWVPTISFDDAAVSLAYGVRYARYTKVGNVVHLSCYVSLTNKGSSVGSAKVGGLPFAAIDATGNYQATTFWAAQVSCSGFIQAYIPLAQSYAVLQELTTGGTNSNLTNADFANDSEVMINVSYATSS